MKLGRFAAATLTLAAISLGACEGQRVAQAPPARTIPSSTAQAPSVAVPVPQAPQPEAQLPPIAAGGSVPVALLLPLSGPDAAIGADLLDAAQLALFEVADPKFRLVPRDTAGPGGAAAAAEQAVSEGARLILGPLFAGDVAQASPIANARGVNVIAFSNDSAAAHPGAYLIGITPDQQIRRIVGYAYRQGLRRFAALVPEGEYGNHVHQSLQRYVAEIGAQLVVVSNYAADGNDVNGVVRRLAGWDGRRAAMQRMRRELEEKNDDAARDELRRLGRSETLGELAFDSVLLPEGGARLAQIAPLLAYYDVDSANVRYLGLTAWEAPGLGREPSLVGAWYVAPPQGGREGFEARFRDTYGRPPGPIARLGYDATALAALLARRDGGPDFSAQAITATNGYLGSGGIFRFRSSGEAETGLTVFEVRPNGVRVVDPAPDTFQQLGQ